MNYQLSADIAATCNALGLVDPLTNKYVGDTDANTIATVKDLIRFLRRDNETHETRLHLGAIAVVQMNLIPLLKVKSKNLELFDIIIRYAVLSRIILEIKSIIFRLLGNLTTPVLLLYNEEIPTEKVVRNQFLQVLGHLQACKEFFADEELWTVIGNRFKDLLLKVKADF